MVIMSIATELPTAEVPEAAWRATAARREQSEAGFCFPTRRGPLVPLTLINSPVRFVDYPSNVEIKAEDAIRMKPPKIVPR
jgi:hypothetical protein